MITNTRERAKQDRHSGPAPTHSPTDFSTDSEPEKPPRSAGKFAVLVFALPIIILIVMAYMERRP